MILDISEEERDFLERICTRAEMFCRMNLVNVHGPKFEKDLHSIEILRRKIRAVDSNLMEKAMKDDNL